MSDPGGGGSFNTTKHGSEHSIIKARALHLGYYIQWPCPLGQGTTPGLVVLTHGVGSRALPCETAPSSQLWVGYSRGFFHGIISSIVMINYLGQK